MNLYTLRSADGEWRITKFDQDLEMESSYIVSTDGCECPQWTSRERQCRHMKMLPMMVERADSAWFFCYEDAQWYDPTGEARVVGQSEGQGQGLSKPAENITATEIDRRIASLRLPDGVTMLDLSNMEQVHNTIAQAVGEAPLVRRSVVASNPYPRIKRRI